MLDISKYYPPIIKQSKDLMAITEVESMEFRRLDIKIFNVNNNFSLYTCDEDTLDAYGDLLNITFLPTDDMDSKRQQILSLISIQRPYTIQTLKMQLNSILGQDGYKLIIDYPERTLTILIFQTGTNTPRTKLIVEKMLVGIVPAHIGTLVSLGTVVEATYNQYQGHYTQQSSIYNIDFT